MKRIFGLIIFSALLGVACDQGVETPTDFPPIVTTPEEDFMRGADLSYVNEMEDCGAIYLNAEGSTEDPYTIFKNAGTDIVRLRLWHQPDWTDYSNYEDVKKSIERAKAAGMKVLLDFHYSDDWADPGKQKVPAAWLPVVNDMMALGDSVYNYTHQVLSQLNDLNLLPEYVQVGNETNAEILQDPNGSYNSINWNRNAFLLNKGLSAVRAVSTEADKEIATMLHVAQPENALWWFAEAKENGLTNFDWIGISYYPLWSNIVLNDLSTAVQTLTSTYNKNLMVVETAYPYTLDNLDGANNILGEDAGVAGYAITEQGQYEYLKALEEKIEAGGGTGLIYWEPAWVSTSCSTRWGQGSHWDNATLFDENKQALKGMEYYSGE
ncbi:glycoside hydrolase family 53 protein [Lewinella cohaerens]|uniref:glycoside hydrolase family 53 protein n=1 Tax=Lewinella cohaerens TaxID=70995 RepID=UPI000373D8FB|nr:glycosyl hydrolase 53 family protein [Lewinella cohaerens]